MPRYERESTLKVLKKEYIISEILETLINYPSANVVEFFNGISLNFPREIRIESLKKVLRPKVLKTRVERASLADEMNYRLSWFNQFTEVQLNNLFKFYKEPVLEKLYFEELWLSIIEYITDRSIDPKDLIELIDRTKNYAKAKKISLEDAIVYNDTLDVLFFDEKGKIDGLRQEVIRPVLYKSSTLTEIRQLGSKYQVNVPKRLKKSELLEIIVKELKDRNEYTEVKETELHNMNIIVMQRFAIKNNIKASTELKKEEVIEYILSNAETTKESYFIPSSSVYEVEVHEVGEEMPEVVVQEIPVVEEVETEVTPLEVEETVEYKLTLPEYVSSNYQEKAPANAEVTLLVTTPENKEFELLKVNEVEVTTLTSNTYKFVITGDSVVEVTFKDAVKVAPVIEERIVEKLVAPQYVSQVVETKGFDFTTIEETHLNVIEYEGSKSKHFTRNLNSLSNDNLVTEETQEDRVFKVEFIKDKKEKKPFTLGRFLVKLVINIAIILIILTVILLIYTAITKNGFATFQPTEQKIVDFINKTFGTNGNFFETFRNFFK